MNELIKKLAEQASNEYLSEMEPVTDTLSTAKRNELAQKAKQAGIGIIPHGFSEKFAQLIVQECLDTIQRDNEGFGSANEDLLRGGRFTQLVAYRHIQARFGMGPYQDQESSGVKS